MFEILLIPAFKDNYIWLLVRDGRAAVVDPGDAAPVMAQLDAVRGIIGRARGEAEQLGPRLLEVGIEVV